VTLYAESSAVLSWLFGEPGGEVVRHELDAADSVVASRLTRLECLRAVVRMEATGRATPADADRLLGILARASAEWTLVDITTEILDRAGAPFPDEPVRALDAIHLASALLVRSVTPEVEIVALDGRVRRNAVRLGIPVRPAEPEHS
jgi:predicted nucleic acid-binding protein